MTTQHTPGPWTVDNYGAEPAVRTDGGMVIVPRVFGTLADANLIATAPELFREVASMAEWLEANGHTAGSHNNLWDAHYQCDACKRLTDARRVLDKAGKR